MGVNGMKQTAIHTWYMKKNKNNRKKGDIYESNDFTEIARDDVALFFVYIWRITNHDSKQKKKT